MFRYVLLFLFVANCYAGGSLTGDIRISSTVLGYDLQYRVYLPEGNAAGSDYPVLFLTDGQNYLRRGDMDKLLDTMIGDEEINPIIAVFVDPRDPDDLESNRRRMQFLCNADYLQFYIDELIPAVEQDFPVKKDRSARTIMGLSFGGTNAACFGAMGFDFFSGIVMQSPANHPVPNLLPVYQSLPTLPLKVFLSTGVPNDNSQANRRFHAILKDKDYDMKYMEVREGHNWDNWGPLLDDVLLYFYGNDSQSL